MPDFLADNNACGQNILRIVSHGNSIIAEILRLKDYIPDIYRLENKADQQKYAEVILDFSYLKIAEAQELRIEKSPELQLLDDEIRGTYLELLERFYLVFECTHQYALDLQRYIEELNRGYYIQQTLESVLQNEEGKQLMCEALYLFGVILLLIDFHIPGVIRERLLVSYYRYSGAKANVDSSIDDVCMLLRSTTFNPNPSTPQVSNSKAALGNASTYPESYFNRIHFDENYVDMVIGRLRCDDIYNQLSIYPHPDHRSTALSSQASMLFICLYFSPKILHNQVAQMREIVDKFFADNWIVSIYMGITINLIDAWEGFKAAKTSLAPVIENLAVKGFCVLNKDKMTKTLQHSENILREGVLNDFFVLKNTSKIINLMRQCNFLLRWYLLHVSSPILEINLCCRKTVQQTKQLVISELGYKENDLFDLLLNISQLELTVKEIIKDLLEAKAKRWEDYKKESLERLNELSEVFAGSRPFVKIEKNKQLTAWFKEVSKEISKLEMEKANESGSILIQLTQALEDVQEFHNLQSNMQAKQYILETLQYIERMIQIINVKEDLLVTIQVISDLSYAWRIIDRDLTNLMQSSIKKQPKSVIRLRAVFLKLSSALEIPLMRINQAKSEDLISVSRYYSNELANYIRKVLQIIPESMFTILAQIIDMQTNVIKEIPTRLDKDKLREYIQEEERFTKAKLTHSIAVFTEGILMMKKTLVGVIELDPQQLLEDGIRKELMKHLANALNNGLIFTRPAKSKNNTLLAATLELEQKLDALAKIVEGYRKSFEYNQDYLNVHGLNILHEELTRLINYNVEKECNAFLHNKIQDWQSEYYSPTIPIPTFPPLAGDITNSNNFIGRLAREISLCTDPKQTLYLDIKATWYEKKPPHNEVLSNLLFRKVREAIGPSGLVGLDRLYSYMFYDELKKNLKKLQKNFNTDKMWFDALTALNSELESKDFEDSCAKNNPLKFYANYHNKWLKVWPTILEWIMNLGHNVVLRQQIAFELNRGAKCESKNLEMALETFNKALLFELTNGNLTSQPDIYSNILKEIRIYLAFIGAYDPLEQVFLTTKNTHYVPLFLFLFTLAHLPRLKFSLTTNSLLPKTTKDTIDGTIMMIGLIAILNQYHPDVSQLYISYMSQFVMVMTETNLETKSELSMEVVTALQYLEIFIRMLKLPRSILKERIPAIIMDQYEYLAAPQKS